jgi:DNA-binding MarR family transcriptional regulator
VSEPTPQLRLVHLLRGITVELDLLGAEFADRHGLHPTDLRALIHLLDAQRAGLVASPGWLGQRLGLNSPAVTALLDRLQRLGYVRRDRDPADRRRVRLTVQPDALDLGGAFFGPLIDSMLGAMSGFDAAELDTVHRFLTAMMRLVAAGRATRPPG